MTGGRRGGAVELPPDWPENELRGTLSDEVRSKPALVGWLAQHVHNARHFGEDPAHPGDAPWPEWEEPKARELRALMAHVHRLEGIVERLHPALTGNALMHAGLTRAGATSKRRWRRSSTRPGSGRRGTARARSPRP